MHGISSSDRFIPLRNNWSGFDADMIFQTHNMDDRKILVAEASCLCLCGEYSSVQTLLTAMLQ